MVLTKTVDPTSRPVTLPETKLHLRVDHDDEDQWIDGAINSALGELEAETGRQFITATYTMTLGAFPAVIKIPRPPLQSVTSITYIDLAGDSQTVTASDYTLVLQPDAPYVLPSFGNAWPSTRDVPEAVTVTFVAGYGLAAAVPQELRQALMMIVADSYRFRGQKTEVKLMNNEAIDRLVWPHRVTLFA